MLPLSDLIRATGDIFDIPSAASQLSISSITPDSRQVSAGTLFIALKGAHVDGAAFIPAAKAAGAVAVLAEGEVDGCGLPVLKSTNAMRDMALMAAAFYGRQPEHMVAVTGTDGKTSTADFYRQFWHLMGEQSASVGTLGALSGTGEQLLAGSYTTPYPVQLHEALAGMAAKGVQRVCMEASSHGLDQHRLDGVKLEAAAFTNIARDHLDYHLTEDKYFEAKMRLFSALLPKGGTAVLNQDDKRFAEVKAICDARGHKVIGFGKAGSEFRVLGLKPLPHGQCVEVELFGKHHVLEIPLVGAFQTMNILTALGLVVGSGGDLGRALACIPKLAGVPGRLEQVVQLANGAAVFIDYAHTPMALANILQTLRPHTEGRLHVVFGCGGDRDAGKRPEMGKIGDTLADVAIVTDDNPRSEDAALIRHAIMAATKHAKEVADRREAIYGALKGLASGDILVIAGKGHEKIQIVGNKTYPFDDAQVAREAAKELKLAA